MLRLFERAVSVCVATTLPMCVQFRPSGHTMDIGFYSLLGQGTQFVPCPALGLFHLANKREIPLLQWCAGSRTSRKHRKTALEMLSRWNTSTQVTLLTTPT